MVELLHEAGVPRDVLAVLHGPGETVGAALVSDAHCAGVAFTGSTQVAKLIQRSLAAKDGPIVPLIAETGGINAMVVDSTALPEQVIDAVVQSAFRSAGQRCSALRLLCVHERIADAVMQMLAGAMQELVVGSAGEWRRRGRSSTAGACQPVAPHRAARPRGQPIARTPCLWASAHTSRQRPTSRSHSDVKQEIFGPVHVVRWGSGETPTAGRRSRRSTRSASVSRSACRFVSTAARCTSPSGPASAVHINRNMIGAVVGAALRWEGLSGTGPGRRANYLPRFAVSRR
jgi:RHH-type proline utilization regulon transcriptional repressor/proline dehydrogenase/delta 1-pyrroline-5-carboxylate dehydrogenase